MHVSFSLQVHAQGVVMSHLSPSAKHVSSWRASTKECPGEEFILKSNLLTMSKSSWKSEHSSLNPIQCRLGIGKPDKVRRVSFPFRYSKIILFNNGYILAQIQPTDSNNLFHAEFSISVFFNNVLPLIKWPSIFMIIFSNMESLWKTAMIRLVQMIHPILNTRRIHWDLLHHAVVSVFVTMIWPRLSQVWMPKRRLFHSISDTFTNPSYLSFLWSINVWYSCYPWNFVLTYIHLLHTNINITFIWTWPLVHNMEYIQIHILLWWLVWNKHHKQLWMDFMEDRRGSFWGAGLLADLCHSFASFFPHISGSCRKKEHCICQPSHHQISHSGYHIKYCYVVI